MSRAAAEAQVARSAEDTREAEVRAETAAQRAADLEDRLDQESRQLERLHAEHEETVYVIEGTGRMLLGREVLDFGPGTVIFVPKGLHHGVEPDIMVMAKGIANGAPVGATITTDEIAHAWQGKTISTFGGNPVSMAALCATQDELRAHDAPANASARGRQLRAALEEMQVLQELVRAVRNIRAVTTIGDRTPLEALVAAPRNSSRFRPETAPWTREVSESSTLAATSPGVAPPESLPISCR